MRKKERDIRVELLRIACCLSVIMLHCKPSSIINGEPSSLRYLFSNLIADPVSIFLLITGFYFSSSSSYRENLLKNIIRIFLPLLLYTFVILLLSGGLSSLSALAHSLTAVGECLITWTPRIHNTGHLWYLYVHLLIVLLSPIIQHILVFINESYSRHYITLVTIPVLFWINDLLSNNLFHCSQIPVTSFLPAVLLVILGNTVFRLMNDFPNLHRFAPLYLITYFGINISRAKMLTAGTIQMSDATFSVTGVLSALMVCFFVLSFPESKKSLFHPINYISSFTLDIYIWHVIMMELTLTTGLKMAFISLITDGSESINMYLRYTILYAMVIMVLCSLLSLAIKTVKFLFALVLGKNRSAVS